MMLRSIVGRSAHGERPTASALPLLRVSESCTSGGVTTYSVLSAYNGSSAQDMRVLPPESPGPDYPHGFLWMLPVEPGQRTTYGNPIAIAQSAGFHDDYNLTCIEPGYAISPWYADNPDDPTVSQETFLLALVTWTSANLQVTGTEQHYLIGFSKSGLGAQGLQFRHPGVFAATASWDAPFGMTGYDGTDPDYSGSPVGGGSADVYGTSANFTSNYQLSEANLTAWKHAANFGSVNRLWIGGYYTFPSDVTAYKSTLASVGIQHAGTRNTLDTSHTWHGDWMAAALAATIRPLASASVPSACSQPLSPLHQPEQNLPADDPRALSTLGWARCEILRGPVSCTPWPAIAFARFPACRFTR